MARAGKLYRHPLIKGRIILPAAIRRRRNWNVGTRLTVEETSDCVVLKPASLFPSTTPEQVFGCLRCRAEPKTLQEMQAGSSRGGASPPCSRSILTSLTALGERQHDPGDQSVRPFADHDAFVSLIVLRKTERVKRSREGVDRN